MPLYDTRCTNCGHQWEQFHRMVDAHDPCPRCAGVAESVPQLFGRGAMAEFHGEEQFDDTIGVNPEQAEAAERDWGIEFCRQTGRAKFSNQTEKRAAMKKRLGRIRDEIDRMDEQGRGADVPPDLRQGVKKATRGTGI